MIKFSMKEHPQSHKHVESIIILDREFIYSDKRGHGKNTIIDYEFAMRVINHFPVKLGRGTMLEAGKPILFLDRMRPNDTIRLTWSRYTDGLYELKIHAPGHVWTSGFIDWQNNRS